MSSSLSINSNEAKSAKSSIVRIFDFANSAKMLLLIPSKFNNLSSFIFSFIIFKLFSPVLLSMFWIYRISLAKLESKPSIFSMFSNVSDAMASIVVYPSVTNNCAITSSTSKFHLLMTFSLNSSCLLQTLLLPLKCYFNC